MSSSTPKTEIKSALVIGGCGSLGHRIVEQLLELKPTPQVAVFDIQNKTNRIQGVEYYNVDITCKDQTYSSLIKSRPEVIFHTASPPAGLSDLPLYMRVNVEGTRNLLECASVSCDLFCRLFQVLACMNDTMACIFNILDDAEKNILQELGVKAFVYTSSASVVHDSVSDLTEGDDSLPLLYLPHQTEIYSHSKAVADQLVLDANSNTSGGLLTTCIRPTTMFGEDDAVTRAIVERAAEGKLKWQVGNGNNLCDWTFNENVIHAQFLAAEALLNSPAQNSASEDMRVAGQGFIITNDEHISFWKFARMIGNAAGYITMEEDVRSMPKGIGLMVAAIAEWVTWIISFGRQKSRLNRVGIKFSCMTRTFRIDKAKRVLGYKPKVSLLEAIERSGKSFRRHESKKKA